MKNFFRNTIGIFSFREIVLWCVSTVLITLTFIIFNGDALMLVSSLVGITSLIFNAKGQPVGQLLMVIFSILYGVISYGSSYYGEMLTYLGMTAPMALWAFVSWLRHPYKDGKGEVAVGTLMKCEFLIMFALTLGVTAAFYFVLRAFNTAHLVLSTISVTTSFLAVYLTAHRSVFYALAYAANDIVLISLWSLAALDKPAYLAVVVCFVMFLFYDIYGFISWRRMANSQK